MQESACACTCHCCGDDGHESQEKHDHKGHEQGARQPWLRLGLAASLALIAEFLDLAREWQFIQANNWPDYGPWPAIVCSLLAIASGGFAIIPRGWKSLFSGQLNMTGLMALAVTVAFIIGQYPEAAMVMVLFNLSEAIEELTLGRARQAIKSLLAIAPQQATVLQADGSWLQMPVERVKIGSRIRVRPGEKIPLDGRVCKGDSSVNQAPITGESLPVAKSIGDSLWAGTINQDGELEFEVTATGGDTTLARIARAVEKAQASRAPSQRFVDRFARHYTPLVFTLAILTSICLFVLGHEWQEAIYRGLAVLVIGCPCALVISIPVTIAAGLANACQRGILVKGGIFLEQGRKLTCLALDKTGTLTRGDPVLTDLIQISTDLDGGQIRLIAASLASHSDHPVSRAILKAIVSAARADVAGKKLETSDFSALPGRGIQARIGNEHWALGNHALVREAGFDRPELARKVQRLETEGKTVVALLEQQKGVVALFAVADMLRPESVAAIREIAGKGIRPVILSGDNAGSTGKIAADAGIAEWHGALLPEDKLATIEKLTQSGEFVGMVGDGINDSPALARADIGFAMARNGTDTAIETADVALMDDDLRKIPRFVGISRRTHTIVLQNIGFALGIKALFLALAFFGLASMWMAVFADVGTTVLVVCNGLRAYRNG